MSCNIRIPIQQIIDDVAAALSGRYITTDNPFLNDAVLTDTTLRGDVIADTEARAALCRILQGCDVTAEDLEWLARPTGANLVPVSAVAGGEVTVSWQNLDGLITWGNITGDIEDQLDLVNRKISTDNVIAVDGRTQEEINTKVSTDVTEVKEDISEVNEKLLEFANQPRTIHSFGVVGDGSNETERLRAYHDYCNANKITASYSGIAKLTVDANAKIYINTNVDFAGCEITPVNYSIYTPAGSRDEMFLADDPETPLITSTVNLEPSNVGLWSVRPTKGVWDETGYVSITSSKPMCNRDNTGISDYQQSFWLLGGEAVQPLCTNLAAYATNISMFTRAASKDRIKVSNIVLVDSGFSFFTFIRVQRNQVDLNGFTVITSPNRALDTLDILVAIRTCGDCTLDNFNVVGRPYGSGGTYVFQMRYAAEITVSNFKGVDGNQTNPTWGVTGSNYTSGCYVKNCTFNRFDIHAMGFHLFITGGTYREGGLQVGCGGGVLSVDGATVMNAAAFQIRTDYGGHLENCTVKVSNITWIPKVNAVDEDQALVNFGGIRQGFGGQVPVTVPSVNISNIDVVSPTGDTTQATCYLLALRVRAGTAAVHPFNYFSISNINLPSRMRWGINGDFNSLEGTNSTVSGSRIILRNVNGYAAGGYTAGDNGAGITYRAVASKTPTSNAAIRFIVDGVQPFGLYSPNTTTISRVEVRNSYITHLYAGDIGYVQYFLYSSRFIGSDSYNSVSKILAQQSNSASRPQHMYNCELTTGGANYDFSSANVITGSVLASNCILPVGCTQALAFKGWTLATLAA